MIRKREGFTLVELLVVIVIIIILAAILFPVLARARERALQARCINNMKQIASACEMYSNDWDNYAVPPTNRPGGLFGATPPGHSNRYWFQLIDHYIRTMPDEWRDRNFHSGHYEAENMGPVYRCPSAPIERAIHNYQTGRSLGYNNNIRIGDPMDKVAYPSVTIRITETSFENPEEPQSRWPGSSAMVPSYGSGSYPGAWHNGNNVVLWFDGSVSVMHWKELYNPQIGDTWVRLRPKPGYTPY